MNSIAPSGTSIARKRNDSIAITRTRRAADREHDAEGTLQAFAEHGELGPELHSDGGDSGKTLDKIRNAGVDLGALAAKLQQEGAAAFVASWNNLLGVMSSKGSALAHAS